VVVVVGPVDFVVLVTSEAPVGVGAGAIAHKALVSDSRIGKERRRRRNNANDAPNVRVVRQRLSVGRNVPGEGHTGRECARLAAALPGVVLF
jgi:hypothetical protein